MKTTDNKGEKMRIIKFRSWNHRDKTMDIPDNIANDIDGDKYQIMQYTGLKDKKGNVIYEGDIVAFDFNFEVPITFQQGCFYAGINELHRLSQVSHVVEVIGNIYENPELLT